MLKLTRLDNRTVAINPDHIAWVESTPDTTLCLLGDRKVIVRESLDEVVDRFVVARARIGCSPSAIPSMPPSPFRQSRVSSTRPSAPAPRVIDSHGDE